MYDKQQYTFSGVLFILICFVMQILILIIIIQSVISSTLRLEKVVILSRHGVKTPLSLRLSKMTPNEWPEFNETRGDLTERGFELEGLIGVFFSQWFTKNKLLPARCPDEKNFFAYANSVQRTILTAEAFVNKAFPNCNTSVHYSSKTPDPIFNAIIHNSSVNFIKSVEQEMQIAINKLSLNKSYNELEYILNYPKSEYCIQENKCHLSEEKNTPYVRTKYKPNISGGLKKANEVIDAFLMAFYNGFPEDQVAWGKLNMERWRLIMQIADGYHNVVFNTISVARDIAGPLLTYMRNIFLHKNTKVTLLMGHDININVILNSMSFKNHSLKNCLIKTPISGKVVFQKWFDENSGKFLLKVEYIYQSTDQIRNALPLSMDNPPESHLLQLNNCPIDKRGFCLWDDFVALLNNL